MPHDTHRAQATELYFEDFTAGASFALGSHTVTREELLEFARRYDPQPFHTDEVAAAASPYGGLITSGWQTCALVMRLFYDQVLSRAASVGSPGVDQVRWLTPVRPGDTLRATLTVMESRVSRSKPDRGVVREKWEVFNQRDEPVMTLLGMNMYLCRPAG